MITLTHEHIQSDEQYELFKSSICAIKLTAGQKVLVLIDGSQLVLTESGYNLIKNEIGE